MSSRKYRTHATMLVGAHPFDKGVIQPDAALVKKLHSMLDALPEQHALIIDLLVSEILAFKNPNRQHYSEVLPLDPRVQEEAEKWITSLAHKS